MQFKKRQEKVQQEVKSRDLKALMVFSAEDIYYFSGFYAHTPWYPADLYRLSPVIVRAAGDPLHVTGLVNTLRVERMGAIKNVIGHNEFLENTVEFLAGVLKKHDLDKGRIGFDDKKVVSNTIAALSERCPQIEWVPSSDIMYQVRAIKEPDELALLHRACEINRAGLAAAVAAVKPGLPEIAVAAEAEYAMRRKGAERFTEETMVLSGRERCSHTRERASDKIIEDGECVIVDMGAIYKGYCSDMATTTFAGKPSPAMKELFDKAAEIQQRTVDMIKPGVRANEVDAFAREQYANVGIKGAHLPHMVGHGVGLEFHEIPLLVPSQDVVIQQNMVFTVEPAVRVPELGAIRFEEVYRVTDEGVVKA